VLDADKEGFLRSGTSLIQTIGRAARNVRGIAVLYADVMTDSLKFAIGETNRRREIQRKYNEEHGIEPATVIRSVDSDLVKMSNLDYFEIPGTRSRANLDMVADEDIDKAISRLSKEMKDAAKNLDFEKAAEIRDRLRELKELRIFV
jgi:excinuclease ABC subunit B